MTRARDLADIADKDISGTVTLDDIVLSNDMTVADDGKVIFGAGSDLSIYHSGSHSYITDSGTGNLYIQGDGQLRLQSSTGENYLIANLDSGTHLYYDNALKLSTTSTGVDVTGTVTSDGAILEHNTGLFSTDKSLSSYSSSNGVYLNGNSSGWLRLAGDGSQRSFLEITGDTFSGGEYARINVANTERMRITSAGNVGIGTSSPSRQVSIVDSTNPFLQLALSNDTAANNGLEIVMDANGAYFQNRENTPSIFSTNNTERMRIASGGDVGIGTSSPSNLLHLNKAGSSAQMRITGSSDSWDFYSYTDGALYINNSAGTGLGILANRDVYFNKNVAVGDATPSTTYSQNLQIHTASNGGGAALHITDGTTGSANTDGLHIVVSGGIPYIFNRENTSMIFGTSNLERMRIASDGDVMINTTSDIPWTNSAGSSADNAIVLRNDGLFAATRYAGNAAYFSRTSNDGAIVVFNKDGSNVGSIFSSGGIQMGIGDGNTALLFGDNIDAILPWTTANSGRDNAIDLGRSATRFDDIFATNGTIQTSDENEKQDIASLTSAEITAATAISKLFKTFKWKDKVAAKGNDARTHTGVIAQQVQTAMSDAGLDASKYAFWCSDTWTNDDGNEQTRMGVRYPELLAFIGAATEQRLTDIETRLTALEG